MNESRYTENPPGTLVEIGEVKGKSTYAFTPHMLPLRISFDGLLLDAVRAHTALGELNGSSLLLKNPTIFVRPFMSREALSSSRIEGTRADFRQLMISEASETTHRDPDVEEVHNYINALYEGWMSLTEREFTPGLIMDIHRLLMQGVRGQNHNPGRLRDTQVVIGKPGQWTHNARFVPPPGASVRPLLENLCEYIEHDEDVPFLIRAAIVHYQFETIHPFEDGNGRIGRLLVPLILRRWGALKTPVLYLSEYFEHYRDEYMDSLLAVSQEGAWNRWIAFFLNAVEHQARDAQDRSERLWALRERWLRDVRSRSMELVIDELFTFPGIRIKRAADAANISYKQASRILNELAQQGLVRRVNAEGRGHLFIADDIAEIVFQPAMFD